MIMAWNNISAKEQHAALTAGQQDDSWFSLVGERMAARMRARQVMYPPIRPHIFPTEPTESAEERIAREIAKLKAEIAANPRCSETEAYCNQMIASLIRGH